MDGLKLFEVPKQLDAATLSKAQTELNEKDAKQVAADIDYIRQWILKQTYMKSRTDDEFILAFLRTAKYSYARTQELIHNYWYNRTDMSEYFKNRNLDDDSVLREIGDRGFFVKLPWTDNEGRIVIIERTSAWDAQKFEYDDICKYHFLCLDVLCEDPRAQINGIVILMDCYGSSAGHLAQITPARCQRFARSVQDMYPARFKAINYYRYTKLFDAFFPLVKMFLKEKIKNRLNLHGTDASSIHKVIPKSILPIEYGGDAGPISVLNEKWVSYVLSRRKMIADLETYGVDMSKAPKKDAAKKEVGTGDGFTTGTYRKINVD